MHRSSRRIIVKPRIATSDSAAVLKPIQAALGQTAGVRYVRPMAGDAHIVYLTAPAQRSDVPHLIERLRASGAFHYVEARFDDEDSITRRTCSALKGMSVNRQLLGLTGALFASVASCLCGVDRQSANDDCQAGGAERRDRYRQRRTREQTVSRLIVKLRNPSASELAQPMSASRMQALAATAGVGMKSVRAMAGNAALLALDTPLPLSEAKNVAARLALNPAVEYAEPDIMLKKLATPNETRFIDWQWNLFAPTSTYTGALSGGGYTSRAGDRRREPAAGMGCDDRSSNAWSWR